jgi:predicted ribosomally synthesized peptide with SipW-like signal peptide
MKAKTKTKALLMSLCAVLLVAASVLGTMAYLTDSEDVKNTFTVGNVTITMDETDVDDSTPNKERDQANSYKLMPGHTYTKDPIIHVDANSEDCYLFVKVDNQIAAIEADGNTTVAAQMAAKGWKAVEGKDGIYVYVGTTAAPVAVKANDNVTVFEQLVIAGTVNGDTLKTYENKTITVTAYAVQKDGFEGKTADQIWSAAFGA